MLRYLCGARLASGPISIGAFVLFLAMPVQGAVAEFYGFSSVFSRFSAIWGPLVFAVVSDATGSGRPAILSVVGFFVIGLVLLSRVDVAEGRASRERWVFEDA